MKLLTEYLDRAVSLERLAGGENDSAFRTQLLNQAEAYRKLATKRAKDYGLPTPEPTRTANHAGSFAAVRAASVGLP
jgi:hypothetical protein